MITTKQRQHRKRTVESRLKRMQSVEQGRSPIIKIKQSEAYKRKDKIITKFYEENRGRELSDREISEGTGMARVTINRIIDSALAKIRPQMGMLDD